MIDNVVTVLSLQVQQNPVNLKANFEYDSLERWSNLEYFCGVYILENSNNLWFSQVTRMIDSIVNLHILEIYQNARLTLSDVFAQTTRNYEMYLNLKMHTFFWKLYVLTTLNEFDKIYMG